MTRHDDRDEGMGLFSRAEPGGDRGTLALVEEVLRSAGRPMSVPEILAVAGDRLPTRSATPYNIVARDLSMDIKRHGDSSRFVRTSPGKYAVRAVPPAVPDAGSSTEPGGSRQLEDREIDAELRRRRLERRRSLQAERVRLQAVPVQWRFVEKHVPGCWASWISGVTLPSENFSLGITRNPPVVVATHLQCRHDSSCECRIFEYGSWKMRNRAV